VKVKVKKFKIKNNKKSK